MTDFQNPQQNSKTAQNVSLALIFVCGLPHTMLARREKMSFASIVLARANTVFKQKAKIKKQKNYQLPKNQNSKSQPKFKIQNTKMTQSNVFVVLTSASRHQNYSNVNPSKSNSQFQRQKFQRVKYSALYFTCHGSKVCALLGALLFASSKQKKET